MQTEIIPELSADFVVRPCTLDDIEPVVALMNTCALKVIGKADEVVEEILTDWKKPGFDQAANQRIIFAPDGRTVGWIEVTNSQSVTIYFDLYIHPDFESSGIGEYLLNWCQSRAREMMLDAPANARIALRCYTYEQDVWYRDVLERAGINAIRYFWHMERKLNERPPEPEWADGIRLETFKAHHDRKAVLEVVRDAFQDHFGYVDRPFDEHYAEWSHIWDAKYEPGLWLLALDGDKIAGVVLNQSSHATDLDLGWVSTLAVRREYRRRGLGLALLYATFEVFYQQGKPRVGLGVDASSLTGATELYRRAGMSVTNQYRLYEKELRGGLDLTTTDI
ncbi:MAG: GNAT family N-acetyltransferase [Anaerolineae bacterium]